MVNEKFWTWKDSVQILLVLRKPPSYLKDSNALVTSETCSVLQHESIQKEQAVIVSRSYVVTRTPGSHPKGMEESSELE